MAIIQANFVSKMLKRMVTVQVILPVDKFFDAELEDGWTFPTIYLLHGLMGNHLKQRVEAGKAVYPKVYMSVGTEDALAVLNRVFRDFLQDEGFTPDYFEEPGAHDWDFWNIQIRKVLDWLPLGKGEAGMNSGNVI